VGWGATGALKIFGSRNVPAAVEVDVVDVLLGSKIPYEVAEVIALRLVKSKPLITALTAILTTTFFGLIRIRRHVGNIEGIRSLQHT